MVIFLSATAILLGTWLFARLSLASWINWHNMGIKLKPPADLQGARTDLFASLVMMLSSLLVAFGVVYAIIVLYRQLF